MGHVHSDTVEEAWRDLAKAAVLATEGQVFGATNQVRLLLRDIRGTVDDVDEIGGKLDRMKADIREKLIDIERDGFDLSSEKVMDVLSDVLDLLQELADFVHEWFEENLPDYEYSIKLNEGLDGIQEIRKFR